MLPGVYGTCSRWHGLLDRANRGSLLCLPFVLEQGDVQALGERGGKRGVPEDLIQNILLALKQHTAGTPFVDDVTLLVCKVQ